MQYFIFLILGIIAICISVLSDKANKMQYETIKASGIITMIIYSDNGNVMYYVDILTEDGILKGETVYYSNTHRKYHEGDTVPLEYYYTKSNKLQATVDDPELVPCNAVFHRMSKIMFAVGIAFIVLFVLLFFSHIFIK